MEYRVREKREKIGMSQAELIRRTNVSRTTIYLLENGGDIDVKISTLKAIAKALHCSVSSLFV